MTPPPLTRCSRPARHPAAGTSRWSLSGPVARRCISHRPARMALSALNGPKAPGGQAAGNLSPALAPDFAAHRLRLGFFVSV